MPVDARDELGDRLRLVDLQVHGGVHRRHEKRRRDALARDVGDEKSERALRERKDVVVVAADVARRNVRGRELDAGTSGSERGRISRWIAAASSSSRSMRSFSIASLWRRAVSIAAAAWLAKSERRRASVAVKSRTPPSRDSLSATASTPEAPARHRDRDGQALLARRQGAGPRSAPSAAALLTTASPSRQRSSAGPRAGESSPPMCREQSRPVLVEEDETPLAARPSARSIGREPRRRATARSSWPPSERPRS